MEYTEKEAFSISGLIVIFVMIVIGITFAMVGGYKALIGVGGGIGIFLFLLLCCGFTTIAPNEALVITFLGDYIGSIKESGFYFIVPFTSRQTFSLKTSNFESSVLKVNDREGNPIEVATTVVYKIMDTAKAAFGIDNLSSFIKIQSESVLRNIVSRYPYDSMDDEEYTLKAHADEVSKKLIAELQERLSASGVVIIESRFTHLAYAPEIATVMLQRQQANAVLSARKIIVAGVVNIAVDAINELEIKGIALDTRAKGNLVSNLLVTMVSENHVTPTVNLNNANA